MHVVQTYVLPSIQIFVQTRTRARVPASIPEGGVCPNLFHVLMSRRLHCFSSRRAEPCAPCLNPCPPTLALQPLPSHLQSQPLPSNPCPRLSNSCLAGGRSANDNDDGPAAAAAASLAARGDNDEVPAQLQPGRRMAAYLKAKHKRKKRRGSSAAGGGGT
eukprot:352331-Chlamydomonas_euryale.AAC.6